MMLLRGVLFGIAILCMVVAVAGIGYGILLVWTGDARGWLAITIGVVIVLLGLLLLKTTQSPL